MNSVDRIKVTKDSSEIKSFLNIKNERLDKIANTVIAHAILYFGLLVGVVGIFFVIAISPYIVIRDFLKGSLGKT
jgi:hypothetical protein